MSATIIFDFDGTLALGTGPIDAYARAVAAENEELLAHALTALAEFEAGTSPHRDGYHAVGTLARENGIGEAALEAAYMQSRTLLGTPEARVTAPPGLAEFLQKITTHARLVLATNAPHHGISALLSQWEVADLFDEMHFSVGKPEGLLPVIREALSQGPTLSVGDIVAFDLAPAMALGADTALVGITATDSPAQVTLRAQDLSALYADIENWAVAAASGTPAPSGTNTPIERHH